MEETKGEASGEPQDTIDVDTVQSYIAMREESSSQFFEDFNRNLPKDALFIARERADKI